jgi:hypothetical protein
MGKSLSLSIFFISLSLFAENDEHNSLVQAGGVPTNPSYDPSAVKELNKCQGPNFFAKFFEQMSQHPDCTQEDKAKLGALANKIYKQGERPRWKRFDKSKQE